MRCINPHLFRPVVFLIFAAAAAVSCSHQQKGPQRIMENGVEVVLNGSGTYRAAGQPTSLSLREEFRVDLEDEALAAAGLTDAVNVDADSHGRIYLFRSGGNQGPIIFQFDERGKLLKSFGAIGQGPGEVMYPRYFKMTGADEIPVYSGGTQDVRFFDTEGRFLRSFPLPNEKGIRLVQNNSRLTPNGNFLALYFPLDDQLRFSKVRLGLFDNRLRRIKDIREIDIPDRQENIKVLLSAVTLVGVSKTVFYVNGGEAGTDISVFDLNGDLKRKIRADYAAAKISEGQRKDMLERIPSAKSYDIFRTLIRKMETIPSFHALFADDQDRLFIPGFGKDEKTGDNVCDVFSPDGVRILKTGLGRRNVASWLLASMQDMDVVIKKDRCYCLREKEDGYKELIVYSMIWK